MMKLREHERKRTLREGKPFFGTSQKGMQLWRKDGVGN